MSDDLPQAPEAPAPPSSPNAEYAEQLLKLERARQESEQRAASLKDEILQAVRSEVGQLAQRIEGQKPDPNDPLATLKDDDLKQVLAQGPEENPQRYHIAQEELWKRREKKLRNEIEGEVDRRMQKERDIALSVEQMKRDFGEDIVKEGSPLRQRAQYHMQQIMQREGPSAAWDPKNQRLAAQAAALDLAREEARKGAKRDQELDTYKRQAAMERGNQAIARPGEDTKAHLKRGEAGVTAAIKSLNLWERLGLSQPGGA